ncbi:hypothetical protein HYH02_001614 [Chlamydomonas schloesseri]|uniref:Uncharacterized protein n=1 Tax=Chlamydomonas schloesseri TaxID=2026947 RepID=A0A835WVU4_9CHLO|nr:hypothetical protein HYH02_001614 [Chlamydomonas schloesseri]|eukprot:KAG2453390.1 hypothetical protein HYH02_001614 [Chlamydomonas schloesseri]
MADGPSPIRIVLWNDGGEALAAGVEDEEQQQVLHSFADLVGSAIDAVLELPQFRHVEVVTAEAEEDEPGLSIGFDAGNGDDEVDIDNLKGRLDIAGLLLGSAQLPEELAEVAAVEVTDEEEGTTELQFGDEALMKELQAVVKRAKLEKRYNDWVAGVAESLGPALDAAAGGVEVTEMPVDPFDVLQAVVAQLIRVAGVSPPAPSLFSRAGGLVGGVLGAPRSAVRQVTKRLGRAQRLWWRLEDVVVDGSKLALRLAVKAARPVLVGFVLHRVLKTLDRSRQLEYRLARMAPEEAREAYYEAVLGKDWKAQLQADWDKALEDVDGGLVTDEINQEKRLMTAAQLRRLEVEEWDKQRMKNFYLASFGGLRWFDQMEQALHNPLFIESRGWTDPVQNWVGKNRTYMDDLPAGQYMAGVGNAAIRIKEAELKRKLTDAERAHILARGGAVAGGLLPEQHTDPATVAVAVGGAFVPAVSGKR